VASDPLANKSACPLAPRTSLAVVSGLRIGSFAELFLRRRPRYACIRRLAIGQLTAGLQNVS
jgi:hypothetical protein